MSKMACFLLSTLLISSQSIAATVPLNPEAMAKTILNVHNVSKTEQGSFAIVYGGEDISHRHDLTNPPKFIA